MALRIALILTILVQQFALPVVIAHEAATCGSEAATANAPKPCCASAKAAHSERAVGCSCTPSLCACGDRSEAEPVNSDRNTRTVEQLIPALTVPAATIPDLLRADQSRQPAAQQRTPGRLVRLQAILCIWRT